MKLVIAPVTDQIASTSPTTVIARPVDGWLSSRVRLLRTSSVDWVGITWPRWSTTVRIVPGEASSVNRPIATRSTDGIAKNEL